MLEKTQELNSIFLAYKISAVCLNYQESNNYCFYNVRLNPRTRIKDLEKFSIEIGLALRAPGKPSIALIPEEGAVRLEFFKTQSKRVDLFDLFTNKNLPKNGLFCLLGQTIKGENLWFDLAQAPHLLIAGTTGSGKSTLLHTLLGNLLNYHQVKLYLMDPKNIEFCTYSNNIGRDLQVCSNYTDCLQMLDTLCQIMEQRYASLRSNIELESLPHIVIMIDEFSDLILQDKENQFYEKLCRLAQKCRAARMHIILGTQRPSVDIISGTIKANFPARIACKTASGVDSKVILDAVGAEHLVGRGDSFLRLNGGSLQRFQAAYTDASEVCKYFGKL